MSRFALGNLFLTCSILATSVGQVLMKAVFSTVPAGLSSGESLRLLLLTDRVWRAGLAGLLSVAGFVFWLLCLQRLPLSYAFPIACSSALVVAFLCVLFLGETVTWRLWAGTLLIALGSALVVTQR